jgi:hypothetical protein
MNPEVHAYLTAAFSSLCSDGIYIAPEVPKQFVKPTIEFCERFGKLINKVPNSLESYILVFQKNKEG